MQTEKKVAVVEKAEKPHKSKVKSAAHKAFGGLYGK